MQLEISPVAEDIQLVKLTGRLDMYGTNEIDNQFAFQVGTAQSSSIVDLSEVDFLASIGMRMLISAARSLKNRGFRMVLLNPTALVKDALIKAGFDQLIPIFDNLDDALVALK